MIEKRANVHCEVSTKRGLWQIITETGVLASVPEIGPQATLRPTEEGGAP